MAKPLFEPTTMLIGSAADTSHHLVRSRLRRRELLHSSKLLSSGNKFEGATGQVEDFGGHRFSSGLQARLKTQNAARGNIHNALSFVRAQADGLKTVERTLLRMEELAYQATDPILNDYDRENIDLEFSALTRNLTALTSKELFETRLFDPFAAHYQDRFPVLGISNGGWDKQEQVVDIGAKRGKIHLRWNPTWQTDRLKVYHGSNLLFDSGEYRSVHWLNFDNNSPAILSGGFDNFTLEFGADADSSTADPKNLGISLHDKNIETDLPANTTPIELGYYERLKEWGDSLDPKKNYDYKKFKTGEDYPKTFGTPYGDTEIKFVVNEDAGGFPYPRELGSSTAWQYYAEIEKSNLTDQSVLVNSEGGTLELRAIGFSALSHLTVKDARLAAGTLDTLSEELGNLRYQMGVIAGELAEFRVRLDVLQGKTLHETEALEKITGIDMAEEVTRMAKNQILESTTTRALLHSRLSAERVFDLLI